MNVTLTPDDAYRKAYAHYVQKRYESAREICCGVLQVDPGHMHAAYLLAVVEHRLGSPEAGDEILQQAVAAAPTYAEAHNNLGLAYAVRNQLEPAAEHLRRAAALRPDLPDDFHGTHVINPGIETHFT